MARKPLVDRIRSIAQLRRRLKPYRGHFRRLTVGLLCNVVRLVGLRLRAWLAGRRLTVIGLPERMGDIVACTPFAARHRKEHPRDLIAWAVRTSYLDVLRGNSDIDALLPLHCITDWFWLKKFARIADQTYDLLIPHNACNICKYISIRKNTALDVNESNYFDFGSLLGAHSRSAGYPLDEGYPTLSMSRRVKSRVDHFDLPERCVCIHTLSEEWFKDWQTRHWNKLIDYINEAHGLSVVEVGLRSPLDREDDEGYRNMCGHTTIVESAEIIRRASLFIGVDSGPSHLANAVRTPGVLIFGRLGHWEYYMPYTGFYADERNCRIVRHLGPVSEMPLEPCLLAIDECLVGKQSGAGEVTRARAG